MATTLEQYGLTWEPGLFHSRPIWSKDPDIDIVKRIVQRYLGCDAHAKVDIEYYAEGGFNKIYKVSTAGADYIMRVSLPVDPHYKTESEVATTVYVRHNTDIPVPRIIAYDSNNQNELKFEWILMEMMPGKTLRSKWKTLSFEAKEKIVKLLARYQAQLYEKQFNGIGNLYFDGGEGNPIPLRVNTTNQEMASMRSFSTTTPSGHTKPHPGNPLPEATENLCQNRYLITRGRGLLNDFSKLVGRLCSLLKDTGKTLTDLLKTDLLPSRPHHPQFKMDRIVSMAFFWDERLTYEAPRGPFMTSYEWLRARLQLVIIECNAALRTEEDEDDIEDLEGAKNMSELLIRVLPNLFPPETTDVEPAFLFQNDLSWNNILVNDDGELTAILDWECVSITPLWRACSFPEFLDCVTREKKPNRDHYGAPSEYDIKNPDKDFDDGEISRSYWEDLANYERTQLRKSFLEEMEKIKPEWVEKFKNSNMEKNCDQTVNEVSHGFLHGRVQTWAENFLQGTYKSWEFLCNGPRE